MIQSSVYRLTRTEMAQLASEEYVRSYWFIVVPIPIAGFLEVAFGTNALKPIGLFALLWPLSIPARSVLSTTKASRLFTGGCHVEADSEAVTFIGEYNESKRLRYAINIFQIKEVIRRRDLLLIRLRLPGIAPIRVDAFESEAKALEFMSFVNEAVAKQVPAEAPSTQE